MITIEAKLALTFHHIISTRSLNRILLRSSFLGLNHNFSNMLYLAIVWRMVVLNNLLLRYLEYRYRDCVPVGYYLTVELEYLYWD